MENVVADQDHRSFPRIPPSKVGIPSGVPDVRELPSQRPFLGRVVFKSPLICLVQEYQASPRILLEFTRDSNMGCWLWGNVINKVVDVTVEFVTFIKG